MNILSKNINYLEKTICNELKLTSINPYGREIGYNDYVMKFSGADIFIHVKSDDMEKIIKTCNRFPCNVEWTSMRLSMNEIGFIGKNLCNVYEIRSALKCVSRLVLLGYGEIEDVIISEQALRRVSITLLTQIVFDYKNRFASNMSLFYVRNEKILKRYDDNKKAAYNTPLVNRMFKN